MSTVPFGESSTTIFKTIKGRIFAEIHNEVTSSLRNLLPPEIKDTLSTRATFDLTLNILDDSLKQIRYNIYKIFIPFISIIQISFVHPKLSC